MAASNQLIRFGGDKFGVGITAKAGSRTVRHIHSMVLRVVFAPPHYSYSQAVDKKPKLQLARSLQLGPKLD